MGGKRRTENNTQCKKCVYRTGDKAFWFCGYLYFTGKRRLCDPSPNCTKFVKYTKKGRMELELQYRRKIGALYERREEE